MGKQMAPDRLPNQNLHAWVSVQVPVLLGSLTVLPPFLSTGSPSTQPPKPVGGLAGYEKKNYKEKICDIIMKICLGSKVVPPRK